MQSLKTAKDKRESPVYQQGMADGLRLAHLIFQGREGLSRVERGEMKRLCYQGNMEDRGKEFLAE